MTILDELGVSADKDECEPDTDELEDKVDEGVVEGDEVPDEYVFDVDGNCCRRMFSGV